MANLLLCLVQLGSINRNWRISDLTANAGGGGGVDYNRTIDIVPVCREGGREGKRQAGSTRPFDQSYGRFRFSRRKTKE